MEGQGTMQDWGHLLSLAGLMLATGVVGGVLAGLLGVGGGIVIVPVLEFALSILGVDPAIRMHVAVATSLATIIPTSISSARAHHRRGAVDLELVRRWGPAIFLGTAAGAVIAAFVKSAVLSGVFGVVALTVALRLIFLTKEPKLAPAIPTHPVVLLVPFVIGGVSALMGIGGGTLSVLVMTMWGYAIHRAVGTSSLFGLLIAVPATIGYVISGWGDPRLPAASLGYVNLLGLAFIAPMTWLAAPLGAKIAHGMSKRQLSMFFGVFLLIVGGRMLIKTFG